MDPRFSTIEQDEVIKAGIAAVAERRDAPGEAMLESAARSNPNFDAPWNKIFKVVFFPDRIYHAQYLNATRSPRYQYNVLEVRGRADFIVLKTEVYLDAKFLCNALRIEYRAGRLAEQVRERGRFLGNEVHAGSITLIPTDLAR